MLRDGTVAAAAARVAELLADAALEEALAALAADHAVVATWSHGRQRALEVGSIFTTDHRFGRTDR